MDRRIIFFLSNGYLRFSMGCYGGYVFPCEIILTLMMVVVDCMMVYLCIFHAERWSFLCFFVVLAL